MDPKDVKEVKSVLAEFNTLFADPKVTFFEIGRWTVRNRNIIQTLLKFAIEDVERAANL